MASEVPKAQSPFTDNLTKEQGKALAQAAARAGGFDKVSRAELERIKNDNGEGDPAAPKRSKYRNVRTVVDGETFDSKREAQYWHELNLREKAGEIRELARQVPFDLCCPVTHNTEFPNSYENMPVVVSQYFADFVYIDQGGRAHVVDAKGKRTALYQLKKKWLELQSGIVIEEV